MGISQELISQLAKVIKEPKQQSTESIIYGTVRVDSNGNKYVQLDGSDQLTPLSEDNQPSLDSATITAKENDRVSVLIKDHTATVIGNTTSPAVNNDDLETSITNFDVAIGEQIQANRAYFKDLIAGDIEVNNLTAAIISVLDLIADEADIENLIAGKITVTDLIATKIDADIVISDKAIIDILKANQANILSLIADNATIQNLITNKATISDLVAEKLSAKEAEFKYANIDFANIGEAAIKKLFSDSGIIKDLVVSEGHITGELVGVTIKGDLIEAGTVKADKLVVKGSDGIYYKLNMEAGATTSEKVSEEDLQNGLSGSVIVAKSITAEKVAVDDLVAFDATIGGFNITNEAIYSGVKESALNTTRGIYMDRNGQLSIGDSSNFLRYFKAYDGTYKLEISADSLVFSANNKTIEDVFQESLDRVEIGGRNLIRNSTNLIFNDYYFEEEIITQLVATYDEAGNITFVYPLLTVNYDTRGNVIFGGLSVSYDETGNVIFTE